MKRLPSIETNKIQLEVVECDCGYHMGIDATYLNQVGDFITTCPSCKEEISTAEICPEICPENDKKTLDCSVYLG